MAQITNEELETGLLYPSVSRLRAVSQIVAVAVGRQAVRDGVAAIGEDDLARMMPAIADSIGRTIETVSEEEIGRADRIITQLMGYARLSEGRVEKVSVTEELNRAIDWLKAAKIERVILGPDFHLSTQMVGADTTEFFPALETTEAGESLSARWSATARRLHTEFQTSVAVITGKRCLGGMLELATHCHFVVATNGTSLGFPEVTLPVVPGMEGGFVVLGSKTSHMSKRELSDLIELIYAFGAEELFLLSLSHASVTRAIVLGSLAPVMLVIVAMARRAIRPSWEVIGGLLLVLVGFYVISPGEDWLSGLRDAGLWLGVGSSACTAVRGNKLLIGSPL